MSILITGDKGYIGSHLVPHFAGHQIETCDLQDGKDYRDIRGREFDAVVHLAAFVSVTDSFERPDAYWQNNHAGIVTFLGQNKVGKFIFTSTGGAMYGNKVGAKEEDADLSHCLSPYAKTKFEAEQAVRQRPNHAILRLANVHGGNTSIRGEASVQQHFEQDNPIVVFGGQQTRDFIHVDLVCGAIMNAIKNDVTGTYNIGSGMELPIMVLAKSYSESRGVPLDIRPARPGEVERISLDCAKAVRAGLLPVRPFSHEMHGKLEK